MYAPYMQVKQYVAVVRSSSGQRWMVFKTGDERYYLFCSLLGNTTIQGGLQVPVAKARLVGSIKSALAHGYGNSL